MRKEKLIRLSFQRVIIERVRDVREKDRICGVVYDGKGNITDYGRIVRIESAENFLQRLLRNILNGLNLAGLKV